MGNLNSPRDYSALSSPVLRKEKDSERVGGKDVTCVTAMCWAVAAWGNKRAVEEANHGYKIKLELLSLCWTHRWMEKGTPGCDAYGSGKMTYRHNDPGVH
jgi:hypothetical protein